MRNNTEVFFAVQETREDGWDYGSADYSETLEMLKNQGYGLIAVIETDEKESFCINEIEYEELNERNEE